MQQLLGEISNELIDALIIETMVESVQIVVALSFSRIYVGWSNQSEKSAISRPLFDLGGCPLGQLKPPVMGMHWPSPIA